MDTRCFSDSYPPFSCRTWLSCSGTSGQPAALTVVSGHSPTSCANHLSVLYSKRRSAQHSQQLGEESLHAGWLVRPPPIPLSRRVLPARARRTRLSAARRRYLCHDTSCPRARRTRLSAACRRHRRLHCARSAPPLPPRRRTAGPPPPPAAVTRSRRVSPAGRRRRAPLGWLITGRRAG